MDKKEAKNVLAEFLQELKSRPREELLGLIGNPDCVARAGPSGAVYQIEYEALWDTAPGGEVRVIVSIDDGGLRSALNPLTAGFLVSPEGKVIE